MSSHSANESPAWVAADAAEQRRRTERAATLADARPVRLVKIDVSFGDVFGLVFKVWVSIAILTVPVYVVFVVLDIL